MTRSPLGFSLLESGADERRGTNILRGVGFPAAALTDVIRIFLKTGDFRHAAVFEQRAHVLRVLHAGTAFFVDVHNLPLFRLAFSLSVNLMDSQIVIPEMILIGNPKQLLIKIMDAR